MAHRLEPQALGFHRIQTRYVFETLVLQIVVVLLSVAATLSHFRYRSMLSAFVGQELRIKLGGS